jgi:4'-phosphopantetheinyl transferase
VSAERVSRRPARQTVRVTRPLDLHYAEASTLPDGGATAMPRLDVAYGSVPAPVLLRAEAARFHQVAPDLVVLTHHCPTCGSDAHGRPRLLATAAIRRPAWVSLARAGDLSVVAITDAGEVGIDVEAEGAADFDGFADVALHPDERVAARVDPTRAWVRKEAVLKAQGYGLVVDPRDVRLDDNRLTGWHSPLSPPIGLWLRDLDIAGYESAVAVIPLADIDLAALSVTVRSV